jgi:hypothetical protein
MHADPICFVTDEIHPATKGGIGRVLAEIIERLCQSGTPVVLVLAVTEAEAAVFRRHASLLAILSRRLGVANALPQNAIGRH